MRHLLHTFFAALLSALAFTSGARGAPLSSARNESPEFQRAVRALKIDDQPTAYRLFKQLWVTTPSFDVAVLLGQTELIMEKYRDAAEHLALGVRDFPSTEPAEKLEGIKSALDRAKAKIGTLKITVDNSEADITIDGKAVGKSPLDVEAFVEPGKHTIKAVHPTLGTFEQTVESKAGDQQSVDLKLTKASEPTPPATLPYTSAHLDQPAPVKVTEPPPPERTSGIATKTIVVVGGAIVTAGVLGTGAYFNVKGNQDDDDAKKLRAGLVNCTVSTTSGCAALRQKVDDRGHNYTAAKVFYGVGAAAGVTTVILAFALPSKKQSTTATNINAWVGSDAAGLMASGTF